MSSIRVGDQAAKGRARATYSTLTGVVLITPRPLRVPSKPRASTAAYSRQKRKSIRRSGND
jgi:hypothetical protein